MSTPSNIAAATLALQRLVRTAMPPKTEVTTLTPAQAERRAVKSGHARLNVALYRVAVSSRLRSAPPGRAGPAGPEGRPVPWSLHYQIAAYGAASPGAEQGAQRLLEAAFRAMDDHPVLSAAELQAALPAGAPARPDRQATIVFEELPLTDLLNLFACFRAEWRPALHYVVSLIDA